MAPADDRSTAAADPRRARFERCFRAHHADLLAFALRRVADRGLAEDAVAEAFAVAWRKRDLIPDPALPWLYAVARRVIANQNRSTRRRRGLDERLAREAAGASEPDGAGEQLARRDAFRVAFAELSEAEREVLRLVAWEGLGARDAARVLGCSQGAFRVRLHRARRRLAKRMQAAGHVPGESGSTAEETP